MVTNLGRGECSMNYGPEVHDQIGGHYNVETGVKFLIFHLISVAQSIVNDHVTMR